MRLRKSGFVGPCMSLGMGFGSVNAQVISSMTLCFMLAVQDMSSGLVASATMAASMPTGFLAVMDSYPSRAISPNHLCLLQISFIMVFYHSIRKATDEMF